MIKDLDKAKEELAAGPNALRSKKNSDHVHPPNYVSKADKKSKHMSGAVLDCLSVNIALLDEDGVITMVNKAWKDFAQENSASPHQVLEGVNYLKVCDESKGSDSEEARQFAQGIRGVLAGDSTFFSLEYACHAPDKNRWFCGRVTPFINGEQRGIVVAHEDITERKKAEQELKKKEQVLNRAQQIAKIGNWEFDLVANTLYWSPGVFEMFEIDPKQFDASYEAFLDTIHPEDLDDVNTAYLKSIETKKPYTIFHRLRMNDGRVKYVLEACHTEYDNVGNPLRSVGIVQDITELREVEQELVNLKQAVENSPICIVITDVQGNIEYVNPAFSSVTGYATNKVLGKNTRILKSGLHDDTFYRELWETIMAGRTWQGEMCNRKINGELYWEQVTISPVKDSNGAINRFVAIKEDISEKKDLENLKADVERIMRHDLKTPLNSIIGIPQVLEMGGDLSAEQLELVSAMENAGRRMLRMIDMSLDLFKMEMGVYQYIPKSVDVVKILKEIIVGSESSCSAKNIEISLSRNGEPVDSQFIVKGDAELLYTMLANIMTNAIEASPSDESVSINIGENPHTFIRITNKGAVPYSIREHLFMKYKTFGKEKGTGLGAYSAKLVADVMGYDLKLDIDDAQDLTSIMVLPPMAEGRETGGGI